MLRIHHRLALYFSRWHPLRRITAILLTVALSFAFIDFLHPQWRAMPRPTPILVSPPPEDPPPQLAVEVKIDGAAYHPFIPTPPSRALANHTVRPIRAHAAIPDACLDKWISTGLWQHPCTSDTAQDHARNRIDLVYMWVNGSDPVHQAQRTSHLTGGGSSSPLAAARFREHDELRYSLRAARNATSLWSGSTTFHIVSGDVAHLNLPLHSHSVVGEDSEAGEDEHEQQQRLGLVPQWLDLKCALGGGARQRVGEEDLAGDAVEGGYGEHQGEQPQSRPGSNSEPQIRFHHHSALFRLSSTPETPLNQNATQAPRNATQWLNLTVPSFNSFAIESQLAHLNPDEVSDQIIALNDDQFLTRPFPPHAFHSPLYGPVFRLGELLVDADPRGEEDGGGEWRALHWTAWVLDQRFGARKRPYVLHYARALSLPLLHELALALPTFFDFTPLSRFRGMHAVKGEFEVNTIFAATHYIVERHREALLWSWVVGKWGGGPGRDESSPNQAGILDRNKKRGMWAELGGAHGRDTVTLRRRERGAAYDMEVNLFMAGLLADDEDEAGDGLKDAETTFMWLSIDGYSASYRGVSASTVIRRSECIVDRVEDAWDMFRRVVKEKPACGDKIIAALMRTSTRGLSVFLPPPSAPSKPSPNSNSTARPDRPPLSHQNPLILPLTFPPRAPPFPADPRVFAVRLLMRYAYAVAETPSIFMSLKSAAQTKRLLTGADRDEKAGFLCVNDDLPDAGDEGEKADGMLRRWFEGRWGEKLECEV
ncbi:hypothetical protein C8F04DRAFT_1119547 [Mycena alexandri]|uniref:Stealth protein CR1 conserved region 1 domain-containing protein n=1 Tax=Mycena alexandri TaxID=1745969 RepID=A0AAD6SJY5_9AGAR|nr:hypothetical protein C8F04DRAFT_1119547 [Mycena alexandri]